MADKSVATTVDRMSSPHIQADLISDAEERLKEREVCLCVQ